MSTKTNETPTNAIESSTLLDVVYTNDRHPMGVYQRLKVEFRHEFDYIARVGGEYYGVDLYWKGSSNHTKIDINKYI